MDKQVAAAIVAASATVLVSVVTVVYTQSRTRLREIESSHRPEKIRVYKRFMDEAVVEILKASKKQSTESADFQAMLEQFFFEFTGEVIVWASPEVVSAYTSFRGSGGTDLILIRLDELLRAMRRDLGNSNSSLEKGELIKLFIKDPENFDALLAEASG